MTVVSASVLLLGALLLVNLLLTVGLVRRVREHTTTLAKLSAADPDAVFIGDIPQVGARVAPFSAKTVDGQPVSLESLAPGTTVVFVAPSCQECRDQVPELLSWAATQERERVLVVVDGTAGDPDDLVGPINRVARVIVERTGIPVLRAFGVTAFPGACVVDDGIVTASSPEFARLPVPL